MSISGGPSLEEVRAIEDDFADAMSRMYVVGNDLARLRARLATEHSPEHWAPVEPATAPGWVTPPPAPVPAQAHANDAPWAAMTPPAPPRPAPPTPGLPLWQREGVVARVLAVVGAGITLIGVAFLLALAIQMGLFGPLARVIGAAVLAIGLVGVAGWVKRRQDGTIGAVGIAATGLATAYLDVLAVTRIYDWLPPAAGLLLAGLVGVGGLLLARAWDSQLLGCTTVLGVALLAPFVGWDREVLTASFVLVLTVAAWPAQIGRRWHALEAARVVPTGAYLAIAVALTDERGTVAFLTVTLALFVVGTSLAGARVRALPEHVGALVPVAAVPMAVAGLTVDGRWVGGALLLALTCLLVLLAGLAAHPHATPPHLRHPEIALATAGATSPLAAVVLGAGTDWAGVPAAVVAVLWTLGALGVRRLVLHVVALVVTALCLLGSLVLLPYVLLRGLAEDALPAHLLTVLGLVAAALVLSRSVGTTTGPLAPVLTRLLGGVAVLWSGAAVVLAGVLLGQLADEAGAGFTAGQTGASLLWLALAALLLAYGLRGVSTTVPAGLALAAFGVGKLLFFDLAFLDGLARVLSLILGGLLLLAMGAAYAHALERTRRAGPGRPVDNSAPLGPGASTV